MVLHSFRVKEFRSVQDSGWIDAEQITALIGTNESGKSIIAILRVVWDEELKSETVEKCEQEFGGILEEYYDIEGVLYEYQFTSDLLTNENSAIEFH